MIGPREAWRRLVNPPDDQRSARARALAIAAVCVAVAILVPILALWLGVVVGLFLEAVQVVS